MESDHTEFSPDELCGCGSGLTYAQCHEPTSTRYVYDKQGNVLTDIPLSNEAVRFFEDQGRKFENIFGRPFGRGDLVFFSRLELGGEANLNNTLATAVRSAGVREELAYASQKTGRIVSHNNSHLLSDAGLAEWDEALDQYRTLKRRGKDPFWKLTPLTEKQYRAYQKGLNLISEAAYILDNSFNNITEEHFDDLQDSKNAYCVGTMANVAITCINISRMLNEFFSRDVLSINRSVFESYLRLKCVRLDVVEVSNFIYAHAASEGTLDFKTRPNGKPDFNVVVVPDVGEVDISLARSFAKLAQSTGLEDDERLYEEIYRFLSSYVHSGALDVIGALVSHNGLSHGTEIDRVSCTFVVLTLIEIFLLEVVSNTWLPTEVLHDCARKGMQINAVLRELAKSQVLTSHLPFRSGRWRGQ